MAHDTIPIKVNAWVDKDIAPLVEAISVFPQIVTVDSCQGGSDEKAYVHFVCESDEDVLHALVRSLSRAMNTLLPTADAARVQIEWVAGSDYPMATLVVEPKLIGSLTEVVRSVANSDHTTASSCDTARTTPHNSRGYQDRAYSQR